MFKVMNKLEKLKITEKKEKHPEELNYFQKPDIENEKLESSSKNNKMTNINNDDPKSKEINWDKNKTVEEIYSDYKLKNSNINTIFMLENFINALPKNLPHDIRKSTVMNIINASNINVNILISDGERRLKALNEFTSNYNNGVTNTIEKYKEEIKKLKDMIFHYENEIAAKKKMLEEQNNIINYETQRIKDIIDFFMKNN